jgi:hypothetical protein
MTALEDPVEDIKKLSRDWANAERSTGRTVSLEEVVRSLNNLRERILKFRQYVLALYDAAELLTSSFKSTELAKTAWESLRGDYAIVSTRFEKLPKIEPGIDEVIEDLRSVLRDLVAKSDQEYRSYRETAHLLSSPANALELQESIKEARGGRLEKFATAEDLKKSLRS